MESKTTSGLDRKIAENNNQVEGWGMDADPENDPTYPMKNWTGADHERLNYERAPQQSQHEEILHSIERPGITRVFGTSAPPSGLSGMLRRYAFKFSEGSSAHWMTLILADRVNVVEGVFDDLSHGHIPNFFAERGWNAEWKYNRKGVIRKVAIGVAATSAILIWLAMRDKRGGTKQRIVNRES